MTIPQRSAGALSTPLGVVGIGCWAFGGGEYWGPQDAKDEEAVVGQALDLGINYFDTAEAYNEGRSEEALGRALKGRRQQAVIGTKVSPSNAAPEALRQHCEASLRRLQTETIDIYMVHWPLPAHLVGEAFAALQALQSEGKIRSIGVSNFGVRQLQEALAAGVRIDVNQLCYNLFSRSIEVELLPLCERLGIGILAYSPLMQGLLSGRFRSADELPAVRTRTRHFRGDRAGSRHGEAGIEAEVFAALERIRALAAELQVPMAQLALAWILSRPAVSSVIVGVRSASQLAENAAAARLALEARWVAQLDQITQPLLDQLGASPDYFQDRDHGRTV